MSQGNESQVLRVPRVPFDAKCVVIAMAGYLTAFLANLGLEEWFDKPNPIGQLMGWVSQKLLRNVPVLNEGFLYATTNLWGNEPFRLADWQAALTIVVFIGLWSVFGAALVRTAALRMTRDEPLPLRASLRFGCRNAFTFFWAPILVVLVAAFFVLCNAVAGLLMSVPYLSWLTTLLLFPLVLVSSLLLVLILIGGLVGLSMMWAGVAVEQNGALEALSRSLSYIFARPFHFLFGFLLIFIFTSIVLVIGGLYEDAVKDSMTVGPVAEDFERTVGMPAETGATRPAERADLARKAAGIRNVRNIDRAAWKYKPAFAWMWFLINAARLAIVGYALYVFLGGTVSIYLQLRREVDGMSETEIYIAEEQDAEGTGTETADDPEAGGDAENGESADNQSESADDGSSTN